MKPLQTPFDEDVGLFTSRTGSSWLDDAPSPSDLIFPATYQTQASLPLTSLSTGRTQTGTGLVSVDSDVRRFCAAELDVSQLNRIHKHLWLAGLERPARPLHQQLSIGRRIAVTECADLHLLWRDSTIYIKPLPDFLACAPIWNDVLNHDRSLHERASGFLLSYLWLVCYRSDLRAAHEMGLIPRTIDWPTWTRFARSISRHLDIHSLNGINVRYRHGELRLARVNWITRLCSRSRNPTTFLRGYQFGYYQYESFLSKNLSWLLSAVVYVTVVLTAMQVGLATERLGGNESFQRVSFGFTVFAILGPVGAVLVMGGVTILLVFVNYRYTLRQKTDWSSVAAMEDEHDGGKDGK
jgi:hypothetical protein